jgi:hypothetical protein
VRLSDRKWDLELVNVRLIKVITFAVIKCCDR